MVLQLLISILLGLLPEVLYFTLFISYTKNIKEKRLRLGILIAVAYVLSITLVPDNIYSYLGFIVMVYLILKLFYKKKTQITDLFIICLAYLYLNLLAYICFLFIKDNMNLYFILYVVDRIFLFIPFIFRNSFNNLYKKYYSLWNRNYEKKQPIKSITIRNVSLIFLNILIFLSNIAIISIS